MDKLWAGRFHEQPDQQANDFNSSIPFDCKLYKQDILGSVAHAAMLAKQGILTEADGATIKEALLAILSDLESGALEFNWDCEDIHSFVEGELTKRIGDVGKKLHTARSRNDQVALDIRMYLKEECDAITALCRTLIECLLDKAEQHYDTIMPGYTHLQRAQPITFGHHLMAYVQMLLRDIDRLADTKKRMNVLPLGSCALAGTTFDTDRFFVAKQLGFDSVCENSLDGVSDRDFCVELAGTIAILMMHLSRLSEEIILWSSWEFKFIELSDAYSTGSSIMPQKKNPDFAELIRGKTGRAYGDLNTLLVMLKGTPLAYNKDMQEDKEAIFDAVKTVKDCLSMAAPMIATCTVRKDNMRKAAGKGFINATDCADYLAGKGMPFRTAYKLVGELVASCIEQGKTLEDLTMAEWKAVSDVFEEDVMDAIDLDQCVQRRCSYGGTSPQSVQQQIQHVREKLHD